jgi:hypothetical protein
MGSFSQVRCVHALIKDPARAGTSWLLFTTGRLLPLDPLRFSVSGVGGRANHTPVGV